MGYVVVRNAAGQVAFAVSRSGLGLGLFACLLLCLLASGRFCLCMDVCACMHACVYVCSFVSVRLLVQWGRILAITRRACLGCLTRFLLLGMGRFRLFPAAHVHICMHACMSARLAHALGHILVIENTTAQRPAWHGIAYRSASHSTALRPS